MILLAHTVTGAVIGQKLGNPSLIITIAFATHFVLDSVPHWNYDIPKKFGWWKFMTILPDIIPSILIYIIFIFVFPQNWLNITLGVTFAILPDFLTLTKYIPGLQKIMSKFQKFHDNIQNELHNKYNITTGLGIQIIYLKILIYIFTI